MQTRSDPSEHQGLALASALPGPLDSETLALLRGFLSPILETAPSWDALQTRLMEKGYGIAFCEGHLVIANAETGKPICTGRSLGVPLKQISERIGRPCVRAHSDGHTGALR